MRDVVDDVTREGALLSINHPGRDTGDSCTGCGWDAPATPWDRIAAMEVVNGGVIEGRTAASERRPRWFTRASFRRRGCSLASAPGVSTCARAAGAPSQRAEIVRNGEVVTTLRLDSADEEQSFTVTMTPGQWAHVVLRDAQGMTAFTNPVYARRF